MSDSSQHDETLKAGRLPKVSSKPTPAKLSIAAAQDQVPKRLGRQPGPERTFTRSDAVDAAMELGVGSFTMRAVADQLGVQPGALYRVCESRDDLQYAALQRIAEQCLGQRSYNAQTWQACLRAVSEDMWSCSVAHPESPIVIMTRPDAFTSALSYFSNLIDQLVELGIPGGQQTAVFAVDFIGDTTLSTFIQMQPFQSAGVESGAVAEEVLALMGDMPDVFDLANMGERGLLDAKIDFIIKGIEATSAGH